jgi:hypothetical protein
MREVGPDPRGGHDFILMEITRSEWGARRQQEFFRPQEANSAD